MNRVETLKDSKHKNAMMQLYEMGYCSYDQNYQVL